MVPPLQVAVLADTHVPPGRTLPDDVWDRLRRADVILHAGDVTSAELLDELRAIAPLHVVLGNNDHDLVGSVPERLTIDLAGAEVAMVHDSGAACRARAPTPSLVPERGRRGVRPQPRPVDHEGDHGQRLFNPGSPTQRRRQPRPTMGWLTLADGRLAHHEIIAFHR